MMHATIIMFHILLNTVSANIDLSEDMTEACPHQYAANTAKWTNLTAASYVEREIKANHSHFYYFEDIKYLSGDRRLIFRLEPCHGVSYLFLRKTRPCWPDPWSNSWIHYQSVTSGDDDGGTTLLEVPAVSTRWFITVFGKVAGAYTLSIMDDTSQYPNVGDGIILAKQVARDTVAIAWRRAQGSAESYIIYSSMYFDMGDPVSAKVLVSPSRILNTVCGLRRNTDNAYAIVNCNHDSDLCETNITSLINGRKYVFNVIAENNARTIHSAYRGILVEASWDDSVLQQFNDLLETAGILIVTVVVVLIGSFFVIYSRFG